MSPRFKIATVFLCSTMLTTCGADELNDNPNEPPVAVIEGGSRNAEQGMAIDFDGSGSHDSDGTITSHSWSFGDGTTLNAAGAVVAHTYNALGDFTVTLTVEDDRNETNSAAVTVRVLEPIENSPPEVQLWGADLNVEPPAVIENGDSVDFTGLATDSDGTVASWSWSFGDGTPDDAGISGVGDTNTVTHAFLNPTATQRTFRVTLTVTDDGGDDGNATRDIAVNPESNTVDYSGTWNWALASGEPADPSGIGVCAFQSSELTIVADPGAGTIAITEMLNGQAQATYDGTITDTAFSAAYITAGGTPLEVVQTIAGNFDSATTFTGTYTIFPVAIFSSCETPRAVEGVKL